jgi:hypothetical protein
MVDVLFIHFKACREVDIAMFRVRVIVAAETAVKTLREALVYLLIPSLEGNLLN